MQPSTIAIDGPAGAGKSTIGQLLADHYGYLFLDTGVLYRAVTLAAFRLNIDPSNATALANLGTHLDIDMVPVPLPSNYPYRVLVDGEDVTEALRSPQVEQRVSQVSAHSAVRKALLSQQRRIACSRPSVVVGRDIGTAVLPDADLKIYLEGSLEERARRRYLELERKGMPRSYEEVVSEIQQRDKLDSERAASPLRVPDDAIVVNTTGKDIPAVLSEIEGYIDRQ